MDGLARIDRIVAELEKKIASAGWYESAKYAETGQQVAEVAAIQEYGDPSQKIPPRPFFRPAIAENKGKWGDIAAHSMRQAMNGYISPDQAIERVGLAMEGDIRYSINNVFSPKLKPLTLAIRKLREDGERITDMVIAGLAVKIMLGEDVDFSSNTKPLNDTGYMLSTLTSQSGDKNEFA